MISSKDLLSDVQAYCETTNPIGSCANIAAAIMSAIPDLNWVGFYFDDGKKLRLGPFQGKPACTEIAYGRGVCGQAYSQNKTMLVNDVENHPDHIVCDSASRAEVVVPLLKEGQVIGVLDIDSPLKDRFSEEDVKLFDAVGVLISRNIDVRKMWFT
ncbi:MAG: GAF domain-containing protein [Bdellovibrionaceae bacterium]|nr:GAF domain-containing protein [Pseudobdellovibrionaceae bacterium]